MERLHLAQTNNSPEINFSPKENLFYIRGNSRPEDVREIYDPVISWLKEYMDFLDGRSLYSEENPLIFEFDFGYFNSSSAKFLYDIMYLLKKFIKSGIFVSIAWRYEEEDIDMKEAGEDLALLAEVDIVYIKKVDN
jgi:hypothetical protein